MVRGRLERMLAGERRDRNLGGNLEGERLEV